MLFKNIFLKNLKFPEISTRLHYLLRKITLYYIDLGSFLLSKDMRHLPNFYFELF